MSNEDWHSGNGICATQKIFRQTKPLPNLNRYTL